MSRVYAAPMVQGAQFADRAGSFAMTEYRIALDKWPWQWPRQLRVQARSALHAVALVAPAFRGASLAVAIAQCGRTSAFTIDRDGVPRLLCEEPED